MAHKYDTTYKILLDRNMCTKVCPCYSKTSWARNDKGLKTFRDDPKFTYGELSEDLLNSHNRTMMASKKDKFKPFVFTDIRNEGFVSFSECFEAWTTKALETDEKNEIDLMSVFDITWDEIKRPAPY